MKGTNGYLYKIYLSSASNFNYKNSIIKVIYQTVKKKKAHKNINN